MYPSSRAIKAEGSLGLLLGLLLIAVAVSMVPVENPLDWGEFREEVRDLDEGQAEGPLIDGRPARISTSTDRRWHGSRCSRNAIQDARALRCVVGPGGRAVDEEDSTVPDDVYREHKLTEALPHQGSNTGAGTSGGPPEPTQATAAEQRREEQESRQAHAAQGGVRDRLVDIGKANHMAGRGNGRSSDR